MAERVMRFIINGIANRHVDHAARGLRRDEKPAHHVVPLLSLHRRHVTRDEAQRLGQFALQFLH